MDGIQDAVAIKIVSMVMGLLVVFTLAIMILANSLSPGTDSGSDPLVLQMLQGQLGPIGQSRVGE